MVSLKGEYYTLYPNPVSTTLMLETSNMGADLHYYITSTLGKVLIESSTAISRKQNTTIDVSNLSAGLYILVVVQDNERIAQRFIKR